jgi:hypothetical protein
MRSSHGAENNGQVISARLLSVPHRAAVYRGDQTAALAARMRDVFVAGPLGHSVALPPSEARVPELGLAGVGPAAAGTTAIRRSVIEASRILDVAMMLKRNGLVRRDDLGVYAMLLDPRRAEDLQLQARSLLGPLLTMTRRTVGSL